eukprot:TRINITY_DN62490_c0_g1_i1.p1 TRINITY_DN62490_c0_g1~~TRINITY_DN62490_c0_g1_i1.p1  ORF type:complete len:367 (+),score=68.69 TRINITY_DN62490_c0_g1_i1:137-1237(+)
MRQVASNPLQLVSAKASAAGSQVSTTGLQPPPVTRSRTAGGLITQEPPTVAMLLPANLAKGPMTPAASPSADSEVLRLREALAAADDQLGQMNVRWEELRFEVVEARGERDACRRELGEARGDLDSCRRELAGAKLQTQRLRSGEVPSHGSRNAVGIIPSGGVASTPAQTRSVEALSQPCGFVSGIIEEKEQMSWEIAASAGGGAVVGSGLQPSSASQPNASEEIRRAFSDGQYALGKRRFGGQNAEIRVSITVPRALGPQELNAIRNKETRSAVNGAPTRHLARGAGTARLPSAPAASISTTAPSLSSLAVVATLADQGVVPVPCGAGVIQPGRRVPVPHSGYPAQQVGSPVAAQAAANGVRCRG